MAKPTATARRRYKTSLVWLIALGLIAFGGLGLWQQYRATHHAQQHIETSVITHTTKDPSETPPTAACDTYKVPASQPRKIELPSLDTAGCIQKVGIDQHRAIAAPNNIYLAGWYVHSAVPGEDGISVIDGHVSGRYNDGIFSQLKELRAGDTVRVQLGNYQWRSFTVDEVKSYAVTEVMSHLLKPLQDTKRQLTLITCDGAYDSKTRAYDSRVLVRASLSL